MHVESRSRAFRCHEYRLHTLPDAPTLRLASHQQLRAHHDNLEALNAGKIRPRFGTNPDGDDEDGFYESACHGMLLHEDLWQQCGLTFSWIDPTPGWLSPVNWGLEVLPDPKVATLRRFRLSLLGGGQIRVDENLERMDEYGGGFDGTICYEPRLKVIADVGVGLQLFTGVIQGTSYEMGAEAAVFLPSTPQSIADRTAATFRLLDAGGHPTVRGPDRDRFAALLARGERCCCCHRPLQDEVSKLLGIGPDCAGQMGVPHSLQAANRVLQLRRELLGAESVRD